MRDESGDAGAAQGLSWSWELDFAALMASLSEPGPHDAPGSRLGAVPSGANRGPASAGPASAGHALPGSASARAPDPEAPLGPWASAGARPGAPGGSEAGRGVVPGDPEDAGDPGDLGGFDDLGVAGDRVPAGVLRLKKEAINAVYERAGFREAVRSSASFISPSG